MTAHLTPRLTIPGGYLTDGHLAVVDEVAAERRAAALQTVPNGIFLLSTGTCEDLIRRVYAACGYRHTPKDLQVVFVPGPTAGIRASWSSPAPPLAHRFRAVLTSRALALAETITGGHGARLHATITARADQRLRPLAGPWGAITAALDLTPGMAAAPADAGDAVTFRKAEPTPGVDPWTWGGTYLTALVAIYRLAGLTERADPALAAFLAAVDTLGPWWPIGGRCWVAPRPSVLHLGGNGLHCADGPALAWPDDLQIYAWRGTVVPKDLIDPGWPADYIMRRREVELRRCAIERMSWREFILETGMEQLGSPVPDPGNPGQTLALYRVRPGTVGPRAFNILVCTNGTPERDGTRRTFGLRVPPTVRGPLEAAALLADDRAHPLRMTPQIYATAARRT